jgi:hypothetical protein
MRKIITLCFTAMLLVACVARAQTASIPVDAKRVLILSPQGVDPAKDTVGFNTLVKNITQAFAAEFSDQLTSKGFDPVNVLDQDPGLDAGQKMAAHAVLYSAAKIAIPTMETKTVGTDTQVQLRVQFIQGDITSKGVSARTTTEKSYVLRGSQSGDTKLSMADIAADFTNFIQSSGRLTRE